MELSQFKDKIDLLPVDQKREILQLLEKYEEAKDRENAKEGFLPFVNMMWSAFIGGSHHKIMSEAFERVARG